MRALELIGNTPLLELDQISRGVEARVFAKAEFLNPSGSVKDRMVLQIIEDAEAIGLLKGGMRIVEATSGNTGVSLAMIASLKGYEAVVVVPDSTSEGKLEVIKAYGAEVVLVPAEKGMVAVVEEASKLAAEGAFLLDQFRNPSNPKAHNRTGLEILEQLQQRPDAFVAGVGTGGTLIGVAQVLKTKLPDVKIVAVEPRAAPAFYSYFYGIKAPPMQGIPHSIEGIGECFVPEILQKNKGLVDGVVLIDDSEALRMLRRLVKEEGLLVGPSSGANVAASLRVAERLGRGSTVVTVLPDSGTRYLKNLSAFYSIHSPSSLVK